MSSTSLQDISDAKKTHEVSVQDLMYEPSPRERELKAEFWGKWADNPECSEDSVTMAAVIQQTGTDAIRKYWAKPGFREWFTNSETFVTRATINGEKAQDVIWEILNSSQASDSVKLKAATVAIDTMTKIQAKRQDKVYSDKEIQEADVDKLRQMARKFLTAQQ